MRTEEQKKKGLEQSRRWRRENLERARELDRAFYHRHKEKIKRRMQVRRANNPEFYKATDKRQYEERKDSVPSPYHGLTRPEVKARLDQQQGACGLCGTTNPIGRWHGDHDHKTGRFRNVLCNKCNSGLGMFNDDPDRCRAAAAYLEKHKALGELF